MPAALALVAKLMPAAAVDDGAEFVMSDGGADRMGDVIEADGWVIPEGVKALFNHDRSQIVGRWENVRVEGGVLRGVLRLARAGTSAVVDMVRALFHDGLLDAVSVGFRPLADEPLDRRDPTGPRRYRRAELLECSLVAVAANPRARKIVRRHFPNADPDRMLLPSTRQRSAPSRGAKPMRISERIVEQERSIVTLNDKLCDLAQRVEAAGGEIDDDAAEEQQALSAERENAKTQLARLKAHESDLKASIGSRYDEDVPESRREIVVQRSGGAGEEDTPIRLAARNARGYDHLVRSAVCNFLSFVERRPAETILHERYARHRSFREVEAVLRATSAPAMTSVVGWAAELVGANVAALLETIRPFAVYPALASRGVSFTFNGRDPISVPARQYGTVPGASGATGRDRRLAGAFVGEGQPIPVRQGRFVASLLSPYKMAVISTFTREMAISSTPAMEAILREAIAEDTAFALDDSLLSADAAVAGVRPPGLFNGIAGLTPTAAGPDAAITDLKALLGAVIGAGGGRSVVFIMNPMQQLALTFMTDSGNFLFREEIGRGRLLGFSLIVSTNVPVGEVYAIDAADFASATGEPVYDISDQATLHMNDGGYPDNWTSSGVLPIVGAAAAPPALADIATPVRSLWQTASIGIRMLMNTSWAMRRPGMVAWVAGVNW
jgi:HK97 family phage prohead protease